MLSKNPLVSVCIPTYNSAKFITRALESIKRQSYENYELVVSDDCSSDNTIGIIKSFKFKRVRIRKNKLNLGCPKNLQELEKMPKGEIIFALCHDDVIVNDGITKTVEAFQKDSKVGVVTRPYYWFDVDPKRPIRDIPPINRDETDFIDINKNPEKIIPIIESVGQLSGLAYRRDLFTHFYDEIFPTHIYPFMEILKQAKCAFLPNYTVAVGVLVSQTRSKPHIYEPSPTESWIKMFKVVFKEKKYFKLREIAIDHVAQNFLGLIQIKNYGRSTTVLYGEILVLVKARPKNLLSLKFWFFCLGLIFIPKGLLIWMVDNYKSKFLARRLSGIVTTGK